MLRTKYVEGMKRFDPNDAQIVQLMEVLEVERLKKHVPRVLRTALIAAAICVAMAASALALSPTLREALESALGAYAPYATAVEGAVCVENGIEIKVVSAMADGSMVKVYAEARDLTGDHLGAEMQVSGLIDRARPESSAGGPVTMTTQRGTCISFDETTGTALLEFVTWGSIPNDLTGIRLLVFRLYPDGQSGEALGGDEGWELKLNVERLEQREIDLTGEIDGAKLNTVSISPLGVSLHTDGAASISSYPMVVYLQDGTILCLENGGGGVIGLEGRILCREFDDPVDPNQVIGISMGYWYISLDGDTAGQGHWLTSLS